MNITREQISNLDLSVKIEIVENDYAERVAKQLKSYKQKASVPGFRKGMAPMGLIERMYKHAIVADEVNNIIGESLYKYLDDEKLDILGTPLANDEKTGDIDFATAKDFTFYFDAALYPQVELAWDKVDAKLNQIKVTPKEAEKQVEEIAQRFGEFKTPETIGEGDMIYGKAVELDKKGEVKEDGLSSFISFSLTQVKDDEQKALFLGHKAEDKIRFVANKTFTPSEIEKIFHMENADAKKFKSEVEFTLSGISHIEPAEINEELFAKVFPGQEIKDAAAFKKAVTKDMEKAYNGQCQILYVNEVRKALLDNFTAEIPEAFLKRFIISRNQDKDVTPESIEANWAEKYLPSLKWEFVDNELNKVGSIEPTRDELLAEIKNILRPNVQKLADETDEQVEERLNQTAESIAKDRQNLGQLIDKLSSEKIFKLFQDKLNPEVEKISIKDFTEKAK